jgi:hypothetical protein
MKKILIASILACTWTFTYAQSSTQLNAKNISLKTLNTTTTSGNIVKSGATTTSSSATINTGGINITQSIQSSSSSISASGATSNLNGLVTIQSNNASTSGTNATVYSQSSTSSNTSLASIAQTTTPINPSSGKLVVLKTAIQPQIRHRPDTLRPDTPRPDVIANLHKSSTPHSHKTISVSAHAPVTNFGPEAFVRLSNKINLVVSSEVLDTDHTTAQLVDAIASPKSVKDSDFALSLLKQ